MVVVVSIKYYLVRGGYCIGYMCFIVRYGRSESIRTDCEYQTLLSITCDVVRSKTCTMNAQTSHGLRVTQ